MALNLSRAICVRQLPQMFGACCQGIKNKKEPWGQTVSRFLSPEGLLVGVTFTPAMREEKEE